MNFVTEFFTAKLREKAKKIEISAEISKDDVDEEEDEHFIILKICKRLMEKLKQISPTARRPYA